jgi:hypothetical protein
VARKKHIPIYSSIPDPWRGRIGLRRARRWLQAIAHARAHNGRQPKDAPTVNFYPMRPGPNSSMAHLLARFPVRIGHSARGDSLTFFWDTGTYSSPRQVAKLPKAALNRRCVDIGKSTVDRLWAEAAGYSISVDPRTHTGKMVEKPEINALKGAVIVEGPLERPRKGMVYQLLIDSRSSDDRILHMRAVIIDGRILFIYNKSRPHPQWFKGTEFTEPKPALDMLSAEEIATVERFADLIGMEYGEMDIVRDRPSGRIYVVDTNRNPVRPKGLPFDDAAEQAAFGPQAERVKELIRDWPSRSTGR